MMGRFPVHLCADFVMVSPWGPLSCGISDISPAVDQFRPGIGNPGILSDLDWHRGE